MTAGIDVVQISTPRGSQIPIGSISPRSPFWVLVSRYLFQGGGGVLSHSQALAETLQQTRKVDL